MSGASTDRQLLLPTADRETSFTECWVSTENLSALKAKSFFVYMRLMLLIPAGTQLCTGGLSLALLSWYQAVRQARAYFSVQVRGRRWQIMSCSAKMKQGSAEIPSCQEACTAMHKCLCGSFICWHHLCWMHEDSYKTCISGILPFF